MIQLMHTFDGLTPPPDILKRVRNGRITAFCLFAGKNIESPARLRTLTESLRAAAREGGQPVPLIGVDQEGGQMNAIINGATELPGNMALGATRSQKLAEQAGQVLGSELLAMGVNINFAPTLDVNVNPQNPVIGVRSFSDDPALVSRLGTAMIRGIQSKGVIATAKHFPGHGDTSSDSHHALPHVTHDRSRLDSVELPPFRAAINAGVGMVMTSHVVYEALDPEHPATLSQTVLNGLLRNNLGYNGPIITDAMDMHAVSQRGPQIAVRDALAAGCDLIILGHLPEQIAMADTLQDMENSGSVMRIHKLQAGLTDSLPSFDVVGSSDHWKIAQTIADQSITVVRDGPRLVPLQPKPEQTIKLITTTPTNLTPADTSALVTFGLEAALRQRHKNLEAFSLPFAGNDKDIRDVLEGIRENDTVIVATISAENDPSQAALVRELYQRGVQLIVIAMRTPYDIVAFPEIKTYLCAYGIRTVTTEAVARVLFGEIRAQGTLPCALPGLKETV